MKTFLLKSQLFLAHLEVIRPLSIDLIHTSFLWPLSIDLIHASFLWALSIDLICASFLWALSIISYIASSISLKYFEKQMKSFFPPITIQNYKYHTKKTEARILSRKPARIKINNELGTFFNFVIMITIPKKKIISLKSTNIFTVYN